MTSFEIKLYLLITSEFDNFLHMCRLFTVPLWITHTILGDTTSLPSLHLLSDILSDRHS